MPTWTTTAKIGAFAIQGTNLTGGNNGSVTASLPNASFPNSAFTISYWEYKLGNGDQSPRSIQFSAYAGNHNNYMDICLSGAPYEVITTDTSPFTFALNAGTCYGNNSWHLATMTYDSAAGSNNFIFYQDGVNVAQMTAVGSLAANGDGPATMFTNENNPGFFTFNGIMDDVRVYNRALTPSDVTQLYAYPPAPVTTTGPAALVIKAWTIIKNMFVIKKVFQSFALDN